MVPTHHPHEITSHSRHSGIHVHMAIVARIPEWNRVLRELWCELINNVLELADIFWKWKVRLRFGQNCEKELTLESI